MAKTKGLSQDSRSGIYYLRRKIPEALRPVQGGDKAGHGSAGVLLSVAE